MRTVNILWAEDKQAKFLFYSEKLKNYFGGRNMLAEITRAVDGNELFRYLSDSGQRFDVLLTDIDMPNFSGIDAVKRLRESYPGLPMIIISEYTGDEEFSPILSDLINKKIISGYFPAGQHETWCEAVWRAIVRRAPSILHLSDIHFGIEHAFQERLQVEDLMNLALRDITAEDKIDLVVVSGDLTSRGTEQEFEQAADFLLSIARSLQLGLERFVIVPGNHDIYRDEEPNRRFSKFVEFLDGFYRRLPDPHVAFARYPALYEVDRRWLHWNTRKHQDESLYSVSIFDDLQTIVIGLNSVISLGDARLNFSKIEPRQLINVAEALNTLSPPQSHYFRVAVFHHNPVAVPSFSSEGEPERIVRNPALLLHELIKNKVRLALHGHTHYSIGFKYLPYLLDGTKTLSSPLAVVGAGTLSGKDLQAAQSYYHMTVIRCDLDEAGTVPSATLIPYRLKDDWLGWESISPVKISFS
jgi:3',5'-cyclic AMP phosphodiesterase CpdA